MTPRLFLSAAFCVASLIGSAAVYGWRGRELSSLRQQLTALPPAEPRQVKTTAGKFDPADLVRQLANHLDGGANSDDAEIPEAWKDLSSSQFAALGEAARTMELTDRAKQGIAGLLTRAVEKLPHGEAVPFLLSLSRMEGNFNFPLEKRTLEWATSDPPAAASWIASRFADGSVAEFSEEGRNRLGMLAELSGMLTDPLANLERMREADEGLQGLLLKHGLQRLKTTADRRALAAAAISWPDGSASQVLPEVLTSLAAESGFAETAAWLQGLHEIDGPRRAEVLAILALGQPGNPEAGRNADAVLRQLDEAAGAGFAAKLTAQWLSLDHRAAAEWINGHRGATWQDQARQAFARGIAVAEPADAMTWAASISDPVLRRETGVEVFNEWKAQDPAAAGAFLAAPGVPDDLRQLLEQ